MAKRSPAANLGRTARTALRRRAAKHPAAAPPPVTGEPTSLPEAEAIAPEQVIAILHAQVATTRNAFFRLAQVRAADRVRSGELNWDQGAEYINAEIAGLDQQLAATVKG